MGRGNKILGNWGEDIAVDFLRRKGFEIIDRNFYTTYGELDIIAKFSNDYYFIEVKTRLNSSLATDLVISNKKRKNLARLINIYCLKKDIKGDVGLITALIIVNPNLKNKIVKIRYVVLH